jgi:hypothetical protein
MGWASVAIARVATVLVTLTTALVWQPQGELMPIL